MQYFSYVILSMFNNYRNIYGDLASLIIFLLLIYFSWTICMAGSRWNYLLQRADKLVRENKFTGISSNYQKFLCLMILDKAEQLCSLTGKEEFDIEYTPRNEIKAVRLPLSWSWQFCFPCFAALAV